MLSPGDKIISIYVQVSLELAYLKLIQERVFHTSICPSITYFCQQRKLQAQAARVVQRDAAVQKKADLAACEKEKKALEKTTEMARRADLTPALRMAEDVQKNIEKADKKAAKILQNMLRLRAAQEIAGGIAVPLANVAANDEMNA